MKYKTFYYVARLWFVTATIL